jgi:hypothetical protein
MTVASESVISCQKKIDAKAMKLRSLFSLLTSVWLISASIAEAQPAKKVSRLGVLYTGLPGIASLEAFRQGLRELATRKQRISPSSTGLRKESSIDSLTSQPSWSGLSRRHRGRRRDASDSSCEKCHEYYSDYFSNDG